MVSLQGKIEKRDIGEVIYNAKGDPDIQTQNV